MRNPPPPKCMRCLAYSQSGYKYLQRGAGAQHVLVFQRDLNQQGIPPGGSFALLCKFEFWAHVMESMQNAKLHSSASIGEGGPLLVRTQVKINTFCTFVFIGCQAIFVQRDPTQQGPPPPPKCMRCFADLQAGINMCREGCATNMGFSQGS